MALTAALRAEIMLMQVGAQRLGIGLRVAHLDPAFNHPSRGPFDGKYMQALFDFGVEQGRRVPPSRTCCPTGPCGARTTRADPPRGPTSLRPPFAGATVEHSWARPVGLQVGGSRNPWNYLLRVATLSIALWASIISAGTAFARADVRPSAPPCPPDVKGDPPTVGRSQPSQSLSDKLADSKGVLCPPAGVDLDAKDAAGRRRLKIIPPPGSPGGNPNVQPK